MGARDKWADYWTGPGQGCCVSGDDRTDCKGRGASRLRLLEANDFRVVGGRV